MGILRAGFCHPASGFRTTLTAKGAKKIREDREAILKARSWTRS
jgi:hypothetical protein